MKEPKMAVSNNKQGLRTVRLFVAAALVVALGAFVVPTAQMVGASGTMRAQQATGGATFDFFSMFPQQYLSPEGGRLKTFMPLDTRNIGEQSGKVRLTVSSESHYFKATLAPAEVEPATGAPGKSRVYVECAKDTPDNTIGWIKVVGTRGSESHHIWLEADVITSKPRIDMSRGPLMAGKPGYLDAEMQPYTGKPMVWHVAARNEGAVTDTYKLSTKSDFPFEVTFRNIQGGKIDEVKVPGKTRNLLYSKPIELTVEAVPKGTMPLNKPQSLSLVIGPGRLSGATGSMAVSALNAGELFCVSDMSGLRPHAHQVMPAETTSFLFHVTNSSGKPRQMSVVFPRTDVVGGWRVQTAGATSDIIAPGHTEAFEMRVTAPRTAKAGERHEFTVALKGGTTSPPPTVTVAAETTDARNIYYWSVDSMNPEYLSLNRKGTAQGSEGDWLMPNMRVFMADSANFTQARSYLPSATDMNHTNALAGTYTGTEGVYMVGGTFRGFTDHDVTLSGPNSVGLMKYGADGKPLERMFEVAKLQTGGKALTGFWSNKNWLADMEGERSVDIVGHSEKWPLFYGAPFQYGLAGDPPSDSDKSDPASVSVRACFHSNNANAVVIPTMLGQFDIIGGGKLLSVPLAYMFGTTPGLHAEDRYIAGEFFRTIDEEDPDVSYVNIGDLDNTGHFTGSSWDPSEYTKGNGPSPAHDKDIYSPDMRRDDALDICREADILFGEFVKKLKERGVYDNSTIVFLSDHGMENMKDPKSGYQVLDLRDILRENGLVRHEDYEEVGGTELNNIWAKDPAKLAKIQKILESYTVDDPVLGKVKPLQVVNREEARSGKDFGKLGRVLPGELYSEYWVNHPDSSEGGQIWPDLFVFPAYNYQVMAHGDALASGINNVGLSFGINVPESVKFGLPAAHGGLQTTHIPLIFKAPKAVSGAPAAGTEHSGPVEIGDIAPTIYNIMGWTPPACVNGHLL
jgi:hypothetical protein